MEVLFGMVLRQTTGFVERLLLLVGLDWTVPGFSTLNRRQKTLAVYIPYRAGGEEAECQDHAECQPCVRIGDTPGSDEIVHQKTSA
jgi:hypothetical protein